MTTFVTLSLFITFCQSYISDDHCNESICDDKNSEFYKEICISNCADEDVDFGHPYLTLPRFNLQKYNEGNEFEKNDLLKTFDSYLHQFGSISIYNHGISKELINEIIIKGNEWFDQSFDEKLKYKTFYNSGYSGFKFVAAAKSMGIVDQPLDLSESFCRYNHDANADGTYGPNNCPDSFRNITNIYIDKIIDIIHTIHEISALSLGLNVNYFNNRHSVNPSLHFRYFHYPSLNLSMLNKKQMRVSQHADFLGFNVYIPGQSRGLQMKINNIWIDVKTGGKYDLILNAGQLNEIWTNKHWKANIHRVIPQSQRRLTLSFFTGPDQDTIIEPIKECKSCMENKQIFFQPRTARQHAKITHETAARMTQNDDSPFYS